LLLVLALSGPGALSGCSLPLLLHRPDRLPECPGVVAATEAIGADFFARMQIQISSQRVVTGYDLVAQKTGDRLVLIGLSRFGAKVFSIVQIGKDIETESAFGPATPVPPENILRDVHRALFLVVTEDSVGSGVVEGEIDGETVRETWSDSVLGQREFLSAEGSVTLSFIDGATVAIDNQRCGYQATLVFLPDEASAP
jgi:hypothetical protein